ncbi:VTT domain-containing protein [Dechloromonas sp. A34]|uniref:VTT domain-containing protein n=1 Tax=Dechloromonas sp. A34 TaxID=447588 RepID=UPI002248D7BC|nr:VTT domain-containing protein [Dechloromonas sp. A34]
MDENGAAAIEAEWSPAAPGSLFAIDRNCCAVGRAHHVGLLVDGEEYFRAFIVAAEQATHSINILAWDFNSKTQLHFAEDKHGPPAQLGDFLNWLARRRRGLQIHVLDWDYPLVFGTDREFRTLYGFGWKPHRRVHIAYDNTHPVGASHHQKIVVIDDSIAFIGGFDLTVRRWDTCAHQADDDRRSYGSKPYPPFHDLMLAVDGEAAGQVAEIVRSRWLAATGRHLPPAPPQELPWPSGLRVDLHEVDVAFARTLPETPGQPGVAEVEALFFDMIAAARKFIYIENQYFTAHCIGDALAARLDEPDGPEIIIVVRRFSHGWLEEYTMHVLRSRLVQRLRAADRYGHFHIFYPHIEGLADRTCIDLHSKLMIVDDEILRIGSANLSNRSMGLDSECDAAIEARGDRRIASAIRDFRNRLLGEHLDVPAGEVEAAVHHQGSLHGAIAALAGRERTLRPLEELPDWPPAVLELASVGDPAQPVSLEGLIDEFSPERLTSSEDESEENAPSAAQSRLRTLIRRLAPRLAAAILAVAALTALWRYTPLAEWLNADHVSAWAREFGGHWWAPLVIVAAYTPACIVLFPRPLITFAAVIAFGPHLGFAYALSGILLAALLSYQAGHHLPRHTVRDMAGPRLLHFAEILRRRSLLTVTALRLVPLAPFAVEGLVAAAIGIRLSPFMLGTLIGMLPGTLTTTIFGHQIEAALHDPSQVNYGLLAAAVGVVALLSLAVRHWLVAQRRQHSDHGHKI